MDVLLGAKLQVALQARRGVFRPLPFVAVGQQHHQPAQPRPLRLAADHELVDHHLGAVGEVAELRLPHHQRARRGGAVAVLEGKHGFLGEQRVVDVEGGLFGDPVERHDALAVLLVVQRGMAMREGADAHVLPGQAHVEAFVQQRGVGQRLRMAPVHGHFAARHLPPVVEHLAHLAMQREAFRHGVGALGEIAQAGQRHAGVRRRIGRLAEIGAPVNEQRRIRFMHQRERHAVTGVEGETVEAHQGVDFLGWDAALGDQPLGIERARGGMPGDLLIHERLRLGRVLGFVVATPPVAHQVDHDVLLEAHSVVHGQLGGEDARLRVVAVDVQDGRLHELGDLRAVLGGAGVLHALGREADLVVDDDVNRAAHAEAARLRHLQRLHHHALAGEGRIAMHDERHHLVAVVVAAPVLAGAHGTGDHRRDDFQVRRIERQRQVHLAARRHDVGGEALVVLHVAVAVGLRHRALELVEQVLRVLAEDVDQHVQPPAVRHADHGLHAAALAEALQGFVQHADQGFRALETEPLGARKAGVEVPLQALGGAQAVEDGESRLGGERRLAARGLEAFAHPELLGGVGDVHVLGAEGAAVDALQRRHDVAQRRAGRILIEELRGAGVEHGVQIGLAEAVVAELQLRRRRPLPQVERVEARLAMAAVAIRADQLQNADLGAFVRRRDVRRDPFRTRLQAVAPQTLEMPYHGAVRNVLRGTVDARQRVEVAAPLLGHAGRVFEIGIEERLDVPGARRQVGTRPQACQMRGVHRSRTVLLRSLSYSASLSRKCVAKASVGARGAGVGIAPRALAWGANSTCQRMRFSARVRCPARTRWMS